MAGVSASKVSRALNGKNIKPEEAERIKAIAEQMGYYGNRMARSIKTGKSHIIGCLITNRLNPWDSEFIAGLQECAVEAGYLVAFADWSHSPSTSLRLLLEYQMDGLILTSIMPQNLTVMRDLLRFTAAGRPIAATYDWPLEKQWGSVSIDFGQASTCLVEHLTSLGHRRIAFSGGWIIAGRVNSRLQGYVNGLSARGIAYDPKLIFMEPRFTDTFEGGQELGCHIASLDDKPTAVMAYNDIMAMGVIKGLSDMGLKVPDDISVCGFDGLNLGAYGIVELTTISTDNVAWGKKSGKVLLSMQGSSEPIREYHDWKFIRGKTTASPKST